MITESSQYSMSCCSGKGSRKDIGHERRYKCVRSHESLREWGKGDSLPLHEPTCLEITSVIRK